MKRLLIEVVVDLLNRFPPKGGVSDTLIPPKIVEGRPKVDMEQKRIAFGSYEMVHIGTTNTMKSICVPVITLKASDYSGGYYFTDIFTRKKCIAIIGKNFPIKE